MILTLIFYIFYYFLYGVLYLLPDPDSLPTDWNSWLTGLSPYFKISNYYFPLDTLFTILALVLTIEASILTFNIINFAIKKIRGSG